MGKLHQNDPQKKGFCGVRLTVASITSKVRTISSTTALPIKTTLTNLPTARASERDTKETETARCGFTSHNTTEEQLYTVQSAALWIKLLPAWLIGVSRGLRVNKKEYT